jgi:hypothetical protein
MDKMKLAKAYLYWKSVESHATDDSEKQMAQEKLEKIRKLLTNK